MISALPALGLGGHAVGFDAELHQAAEALQHENPGWMIMWATWRRKFCAFSCKPSTTSLVLEAATPESLIPLLRQAEAEMRDL